MVLQMLQSVASAPLKQPHIKPADLRCVLHKVVQLVQSFPEAAQLKGFTMRVNQITKGGSKNVNNCLRQIVLGTPQECFKKVVQMVQGGSKCLLCCDLLSL